eukprot:6059983-Ditylum_brightwellii.AAC.1
MEKSSISQGDNLSSTQGAEEGQNDTIARLLKRTEVLEQSQQEHRKEAKANEEIINAIRKEESDPDNADLADIWKKADDLI